MKGPEVTERTAKGGGVGDRIGPEAYQALYEHSPDGVLFTVPDGRVMAANPAACEILQLTEGEICARGRQGLADPTDERWGLLLAVRASAGSVHGVARMTRGDGALIEVEMSAKIFTNANGEERTCTVLRDVTERVTMERKLIEMSAQLRELALNDELTGLRNRRGFLEVSSHILQLADRQQVPTQLVLLDVDNMKELNDQLGHNAGDAGLRAVAQALSQALRRADVVSRIGGDEFVALVLGLDKSEREAIERRIRRHLGAAPTIAAVGAQLEVSVGWSERAPGQSATIGDLLEEADRVMYRAKSTKREYRRTGAAGAPRPDNSPRDPD